MHHAPVALFLYNRPSHARATIEALAANELAPASDLHVFCDGPKTPEHRPAVGEVRRLARSIRGFRSVRVVERPANLGLAASIITGVGSLIGHQGSVIVVEDDLITSRRFLAFMNEALAFYRDDPRAFSISGYVYPPSMLSLPQTYAYDAFASYRGHSWGWATWADRWHSVDWAVADFDRFMEDPAAQNRFDRGGKDLTGMLGLQMRGRIDSWAIRFCYAHFRHEAYCIYPVRSLVDNIGFDGSGVHCAVQDTAPYKNTLDPAWQPRRFPPASIDQEVARRFKAMFDDRLC